VSETDGGGGAQKAGQWDEGRSEVNEPTLREGLGDKRRRTQFPFSFRWTL